MGRTSITQEFGRSVIPAVNVASVPQRSPLRYPGGKTWLIPHIRKWLGSGPPTPLLIEPFAGGGIVSLTAIMEGQATRALMVDLDRDVSSFWRAALDHGDELIARILAFSPDRDGIEQLARQPSPSVLDHGFRTLVLNHTRRGGVLAPGASLTRQGGTVVACAPAGIPPPWPSDSETLPVMLTSCCFMRVTVWAFWKTLQATQGQRSSLTHPTPLLVGSEPVLASISTTRLTMDASSTCWPVAMLIS